MKFTYDWLMDYLDTTAGATDVADTLTRIGLEIEDMITSLPPIAAKIVSIEKHPDSDHLHILQIDDGSGVMRQVVCGAPNVRVGMISALALPGVQIMGTEIKSGKVRGVLSNGMMCSAKELGRGDDHDGIIELPAKTIIGQALDGTVNTVVFDAGITPNRPDYLAVIGIARDLAASGIGTYIDKPITALADVSGARRVVIKNESACPTYRMCEIHNIKNTSSDPIIASRLAAIGIGPKNAPIDATNYICYDMCQPMHCFDADEIMGDIVVRDAQNGEAFTDLMGNAHKLIAGDLVITDNAGILALAGVIGGSRGMTTDKTKNIILECAYFDPVTVRKTSKRIGVSTDASYRYERGISPVISADALARAAQIIMDRCGGDIVVNFTAGRTSVNPIKIDYNPSDFLKNIGLDLMPATQKKILQNLGYKIIDNGDTWALVPPYSRVDVVIAQNVISDLIRLYGYDKIHSAGTYACAVAVMNQDPNIEIKHHMTARGLSEHRSFGFGSSVAESVLTGVPSIMIANPITSELDAMRGSLIGNMIDAVSNNEKRGYPDVNMFEIGTVFDGDAPGQQRAQIVIARSGNTSARHWMRRNRVVDVFDAKQDLLSLIGAADYIISTENPPKWAHPYRYGAIMIDGRMVAQFGELHPMAARHWKLKTPVMIGLVEDIDNLPKSPIAPQIPITEFQPIVRDYAFVTDFDFPAGKIIDVARSVDARIADVAVFDAFDLNDGKKSVAITIKIIPTDNMNDADLMAMQISLIRAVEKHCPAKLRA